MLSPLAWIYAQIANLRNWMYDRGLLRSYDLGARTISIGNITTGGTAKTPLVAHVAEILSARGERVCILTRGYGRQDPNKRVLVSNEEQILAGARDAGDEPLELAQRLLGKAIVVADADRVSAANWVKSSFGITAFVLDDGFQHRRAKRDVDIVCIDATNPFGGRKMLPAGRLREPVKGLQRADIVVVTRCNLVEDLSDLRSEVSYSEISNLRSEVSELAATSRVFLSVNKISRMVGLDQYQNQSSDVASSDDLRLPTGSREITTDDAAQMRAFAFCGLGNPENFFAQLRQESFAIIGTKCFPDHHLYSQNDIDAIVRDARNVGAQILLTTAKDAVKIDNLEFTLPCFVVGIEMRLDDEGAFASLL
jgi:tetraacyldisaccharide 4'-kinase